jgi:hypothetical protein
MRVYPKSTSIGRALGRRLEPRPLKNGRDEIGRKDHFAKGSNTSHTLAGGVRENLSYFTEKEMMVKKKREDMLHKEYTNIPDFESGCRGSESLREHRF